MLERILLAIDAGGTRTRCVVASSSGRVLGGATSGPANHILDGWEIARASLSAAVAQALEAAGRPRLDAVVAASAGVGPQGEGRELVESLLTSLLPSIERVRATGDMVAAFWGALREPVGVVVSAGTGSVCFGRNAAGDSRQVGGWGPLLGDEGSAYRIAIDALRAVARAEDGRAEPTALRELLLRAWNALTPQELALRLYAEGVGRERIASLAVEVASGAHQGDPVARSILRHAAEELGLAAVTALRLLTIDDGAVSYTGSVFEAGAPVLVPFAAYCVRALSGVHVEAPFLPAIGGALRLAWRDTGEAERPDVLESWRETLPRASL